jgi:hypothetical protein
MSTNIPTPIFNAVKNKNRVKVGTVINAISDSWQTTGEILAKLKAQLVNIDEVKLSRNLSYLYRANQITRMGKHGEYKFRRTPATLSDLASPSHRLATIAKEIDELEKQLRAKKHEARLLIDKI